MSARVSISGSKGWSAVGSGRAVVRGRGGLPINAQQEQFSVAFVRMVAAAAGCSIKPHDTDYDGVDITIASSVEYQTMYCPQIEMQLKCTTQHTRLGAHHLSWTLARDPFLKLVNRKRYTPALLGVLLIPADPDRMLDLSEERLISESRMYWQFATELGDIANGKASKTVHLPRTNLFDVEGLLEIMRTIGDRTP
ncbi:DUF4365 domain-containing protein [Nocardia sp. NPDC057272]|uniref:DUF4365 domain-containing protein n=1 Tax=Nocardia sp. NPDC057272 TaxID=3346079 RepID=UPI003641F069